MNTLLDSGQGLEGFYQFTPIDTEKWTPFATIISEGHLPEVSVGISAEEGHISYVNTPGRSYADFVTAWNLQRGDMVTLAKAVEDSYKTHEVDIESEHYLNNSDD
jgi:hypothetical protein